MTSRDHNFGPVRRRHGLRAAAAALLILVASTAGAVAQSKHAAMIIDANSGETLHADKADEQRYPASLTKMMTLYMVFEQLEKGRLSPSSKITVSQQAASAQPTKLDLEPGEQIAVMDAIKALITKSANDMAIALAEAIGGTEAQFAELMTAKARTIGMRNTRFVNASGLPDTRQVTTAHDMLILALHLQDDFPKYFPLFALTSFTYNGSTHRNHNTMLNSFEGIDGIKTGYTRMSGFNLVTSLHRGDKHLVGAVFGGTTAGTRNLTMRMLLTRALLKASTRKTRRAAPVLVARAKPVAKPDHAKPAAVVAAIAPAKPKPQILANPKGQKPVPSQPPQPNTTSTAPAATAPEPIQLASTAPEPAPEPAAVEAAPTAVSTTPIEIAKVRPVMVAPRVKRTAFVIPPDPTETAVAPADVAERQNTPAVAAAVAALSEPPPVRTSVTPRAEPVVPPIVVTQPAVVSAPLPKPVAPSRPAVAAVPRPLAPPTAPAAVVQTVAMAQPITPQRGTLPSTLQAQAQNLGRGVPTSAAMPSPVQPAVVRGPAPAGALSGFHIQIGAYASATEAERVLRDTQSRASGLLKSATPLTAPVQKENRMLYRARFAGFNAQAAANTCLELRRTAIDCFVMKAE